MMFRERRTNFMRMTILGKGMEVSDYLRESAEKQANKLSKYFRDDTPMQITMSIQHNRHIVEITIPYKGGVIRAEECSDDMYNSISGALKKIERQVLKYRTKLERDLRSGFDAQPVFEEQSEYDDHHEGRVVKTKKFAMKPMTVDEAIMQFELIGHPFYVFCNSETNAINVLYIRHDGDFGLIEPLE